MPASTTWSPTAGLEEFSSVTNSSEKSFFVKAPKESLKVAPEEAPQTPFGKACQKAYEKTYQKPYEKADEEVDWVALVKD